MRHEGFKLLTLIPLKLFLFCDMENRFVDANRNKPIFYLVNYIFSYKKYSLNVQGNINVCIFK